MELRAFAEQVLFATSLEDKLRPPGTLTDEHPGPAREAPVEPGRPPGLGFKPPGQAPAEFPGLHRLEQARERGRLLHFFANHELLATELMALVLLRFPDAPAAFRRGVLQTLRDEQDHTRFYLERMAACGIGFGELPVSGYFWKAVSPMESPIDYVAGLSLTFEQANLDYCRHFARGFATVGDADTAALLERIYRDEIAHVAYGLKWFRRWKDPGQSDWDAFCRHLRFPLSPQRAKGFSVNVEGRRAAGLDPDFIARLEVYSRSKGRTPTVWWFNPFAEGALARGPAFQPTALQARLASDLETLPQFLGRQDDVVLVRRAPRAEFLATLQQAGFPLPEFVTVPGLEPGAPPTPAPSVPAALAGRKLGRIRPWAWAPDSLAFLRALFPQVTGDSRSPEDCHSEAFAPLFAKTWSCEFLREHLRRASGPGSEPWLCPDWAVGVCARSESEVLRAVDAVRARGHLKVVIKRSLGLAGQGSLRLWEPELADAQRRWIAGAVREGEVVVEPWLDRLLDFSLQLEMTGDGLAVRGWTGLVNDLKGQFVANWAEPGAERQPPSAVRGMLARSGANAAVLQDWFEGCVAALGDALGRVGFLGPLGIDALVYRDAEGRARLKPVVEINPRHTMGRVALELMRHTCPGTFGVFQLVNLPALRRLGAAGFVEHAARLAEHAPVRREGQPMPRLHSGSIPLTDPARAEAVLAVFHAGRTLAGALGLAGLPAPVPTPVGVPDGTGTRQATPAGNG